MRVPGSCGVHCHRDVTQRNEGFLNPQKVALYEVCGHSPVMCRLQSRHHQSIKILKATLPIQSLQCYRTFCIGRTCPYTPRYAGYCALRVLSIAPPLALVVVDGSELQGKNLACMHSSTGKMRCSFAVAARREFFAAASTSGVVVVAVPVKEHAVEVDRFAALGTSWGGSVLEMGQRRDCCGLLAVGDTIEAVRSAACFGYSMLRLDLP